MLPFLFLNVVVSAVVVLSILFWWERRDGGAALAEPTEAFGLVNGVLPTPNIAAPPSGTVAPEATAAAAPGEQVVHTVAAGETLNMISQQYDVSVDDIMLVNGMDNPNFIAVGQQLTIPVGGIPTPTTAPPTEEVIAALPSPIPTEPAAAGGTTGQIGITGVLDTGVLDTEAVQFVNSGAQEQSMQGWKVRDEDGNVYTFGEVRIFGEGAGVLLHTRAGDDTFSDVYWGLSEPVWRSGETLTLWDANDQVVATFVVP